MCHSDSLTVEAQWPGLSFPRIPGHEIAGVIDALGAGVVGWRAGQRVGVGWFGGHCGHCEPCRRGWLIDCRNLRIPGISYDGGYAEAMVAPADALAAIPDEFGAAEAAPLLCAGLTTFNALRQSGAMPGDVNEVRYHRVSRAGSNHTPARDNFRLSPGQKDFAAPQCLRSE